MENLFTKKVPLFFETEESQLIVGDSFKILTKMKPESVDMIFADPPYALKELITIPDKIFEYNLLKEDGIFVLEHGKDQNFENHPHFIEHRHYGSVNFSFFR